MSCLQRLSFPGSSSEFESYQTLALGNSEKPFQVLGCVYFFFLRV